MPDTNAPNTASTGEHKSNREVTEKLQKALHKKNAAYADSNIQPVVNDQNITLNGTVRDEGQREMALQLARAYAGNRQVVDRLSIQP